MVDRVKLEQLDELINKWNFILMRDKTLGVKTQEQILDTVRHLEVLKELWHAQR